MFFHKELTEKKWQSMPTIDQMANIGTEIDRTIKWRASDATLSLAAFNRGIELLDATIGDPKNTNSLKELCRVRELLVGHFYFNNMHEFKDEEWHRYFMFFCHASAVARGF